MSFHVISCHFWSFHVISCHFISFHVISSVIGLFPTTIQKSRVGSGGVGQGQICLPMPSATTSLSGRGQKCLTGTWVPLLQSAITLTHSTTLLHAAIQGLLLLDVPDVSLRCSAPRRLFYTVYCDDKLNSDTLRISVQRLLCTQPASLAQVM
jgi:hypothetical protein